MYIWEGNMGEQFRRWQTSLGNLGKSMEQQGMHLGKQVLHKQKGDKARKRGRKRLGWWWVLVASTVFQWAAHHLQIS